MNSKNHRLYIIERHIIPSMREIIQLILWGFPKEQPVITQPLVTGRQHGEILLKVPGYIYFFQKGARFSRLITSLPPMGCLFKTND